MRLTGQQLGHYRIAAKLGEGGMGVVYRAHDTRLGRDVAIKVLPDAVARDPERLARFEREARTLAALNHPNIAAVYGVEQGALVMELVEGETLKGPLPLDTAINYARQIADALEAAHERGIIHRDLKPANIKITPEGKVKLLDFGLAKAMELAPGPIPESSPTLTAHASMSGIIVGTPAYMSPEQARGTRVDHRTDIWAFGVVLYEMVTGKRLFDGPTVSDVLAAVLTKEPSLDALPAQLRPLLARCLERDPRKRLGWIGEAHSLFDAPAPLPGARPRWVIPALVLTALIGVTAGWIASRFSQPAAEPPPVRAFSFTPDSLSASDVVHRAVISPNGKYIAYVADSKIWIRDLASEQVRPLEGTGDADGPFWSPDSAYVAFAAGREVKKTAIASGAPVTVAEIPGRFRGGAWSPDGRTLIVSAVGAGLLELSAQGGGVPRQVKASDRSPGAFYYPNFLPGAGRLLLAAHGNRQSQTLEVIDLDTGNTTTLREGAYPAWSNTEHILFQPSVFSSGLLALPYSPGDRAPAGEAIPIQSGGSDFSASNDGAVVWLDPVRASTRRLVWMDRSGKREVLPGTPQATIGDLALSPDGTRVAYVAEEQGNPDVWILDLKRSVRSRFTSDAGRDGGPRWDPSGKEIAFGSSRGRQADIHIQPADGSTGPHAVVRGTQENYPDAWSPDGSILLLRRVGLNTGGDIWIARRKADGSFDEPSVWLQTPFDENGASFSPDGQFVLYTSNESGESEVYMRSFPDGKNRRQISSGGGYGGRWSGVGKEIFYLQRDTLFAVAVDRAAATIGVGLPLFKIPDLSFNSVQFAYGIRRYEVSPDGKRFLVAVLAEGEAANPPAIHVIENFGTLLKQKASGAR